MTTPTRWWAPAGAGIGPDELDMRRLSPGTDARMDLAAAVLTAHRVGAAACEAAAATPLLSSQGFISTLAAARLALADPMVDSISKCLGDGAYAGLLVRDVLDGADEAALGIFRSAVSKGVAVPLAAARAGYAYGVPAEALGKYRALACDPRTNPAALLDAADRALFGYVEKLADAESVPDVSKATSASTATSTLTSQERAELVLDEPRDEQGRWTKQETVLDRIRARVQAEAAPAVDTMPAVAAKPAMKIKRRKKVRRLVPTGQTQTKTEMLTATATAAAAKPLVAGQLQGDPAWSVKRRKADLNTPDESDEWTRNTLDMVPGEVEHEYKPQQGDAVMVMSFQDGQRWIKRMAASSRTGTKGIRMGWLTQEHHEPVEFDTSSGSDHTKLREMIASRLNHEETFSLEIPASELPERKFRKERSRVLESRIEDFLRDVVGNEWTMEDRDDVGWNVNPDNSVTVYLKQPPTVYQFMFRDPSVNQSKHGDRFNPNQAYILQDEDLWDQSFDSQRVLVITALLSKIDDDTAEAIHKSLSKADTLTSTDRARLVLAEPRDAAGRWTAGTQATVLDTIRARAQASLAADQEPEAEVQQAAAPAVRRVRRKKRIRRSAAARQAVQATSRQGQLVASSTAQLSPVMARAAAQLVATVPSDPDGVFEPDHHYAVLTNDDWLGIVGADEFTEEDYAQALTGGQNVMDEYYDIEEGESVPALVNASASKTKLLHDLSKPGMEARKQLIDRYTKVTEHSDYSSLESVKPGDQSKLAEIMVGLLAEVGNNTTVLRANTESADEDGAIDIQMLAWGRTPIVLVDTTDASMATANLHYMDTGNVTHTYTDNGMVYVVSIPVHLYQASDKSPDPHRPPYPAEHDRPRGINDVIRDSDPGYFDDDWS